MSDPLRPERGVILEADSLLARLESLASDGDRERYQRDDTYRWVIQRLWIAVGNEAARLESASIAPEPWRALRLLRNSLAHERLADIDEDAVWRLTVLRPHVLRQQLADRWT